MEGLNDVFNATFEMVGACIGWINVRKIWTDKKVVGIAWATYIFFSSWGYWNIYFYSSVNCTLSWAAGIFLALANTTWTLLAIKYRKN